MSLMHSYVHCFCFSPFQFLSIIELKTIRCGSEIEKKGSWVIAEVGLFMRGPHVANHILEATLPASKVLMSQVASKTPSYSRPCGPNVHDES